MYNQGTNGLVYSFIYSKQQEPVLCLCVLVFCCVSINRSVTLKCSNILTPRNMTVYNVYAYRTSKKNDTVIQTTAVITIKHSMAQN